MELLPWNFITEAGAVGCLGVVFFMVMTGKLATPAHVKSLLDRIAYLESVIKEQREAVLLSAQNAGAVKQVGQVVEHTMGAISEKAEAE